MYILKLKLGDDADKYALSATDHIGISYHTELDPSFLVKLVALSPTTISILISPS